MTKRKFQLWNACFFFFDFQQVRWTMFEWMICNLKYKYKIVVVFDLIVLFTHTIPFSLIDIDIDKFNNFFFPFLMSMFCIFGKFHVFSLLSTFLIRLIRLTNVFFVCLLFATWIGIKATTEHSWDENYHIKIFSNKNWVFVWPPLRK